tara:strand:- start:217 stop:510 length:294 start_codon:yes stop_codon:yes gene_type:complete
MERHDHELKQREDQIIHVTNESGIVNSFELRIDFEYKNKKYGAYCNYEPEGRGICDIGLYDLSSSRDIEPPLFDDLYYQVRKYFKHNFHIDEKILDW